MAKKYKVGFTCGVYDLFHIGHLNLLERCKAMCDHLIVGVCDDEYVRKCKNHEPVIGEQDRLRIIAALKCVDEAEIIDFVTTDDKMVAYEKFKMNVIFAGSDWEGSERFQRTVKQFEDAGIEMGVEFLPYTQSVSTTMLVEKLKKQGR